MKRRSFIKKGTAAASLMGLSIPGLHALSYPEHFEKPKGHDYKMKFAPHLGMFKHHAGKDPIDQLNFMADKGFTAFEDNGMKKREVSLQEAMAKTMTKRGMTMGVFVAHKMEDLHSCLIS